MASRPPGRMLGAAEGVTSLLVFALGDARFALPTAAVREVVRAVLIARLPGAPPIVEGAINVRGTVVPVFDVRARFGIASAPLNPEQHFILAETRAQLVALHVDRALDLIDVGTADIEPASAMSRATYVAGIARLPDGILVIHDLDAFLSLDEAYALAGALRSDSEQPPSSGMQA